MTGEVSFRNHKMMFDGVTWLPFAAVSVFLQESPNIDMASVWNFFEPGLVGTPRTHFLIEWNAYLALPTNEKRRYKNSPLKMRGGNFAVSQEFSGGFWNNNLGRFVDYILQNGFKVLFFSNPAEVQKQKSKLLNISKFALPWGDDHDGYYVHYENNISPNEKIEGLVSYLEWEYECIVGYARDFFQQDNLERIPVILSNKRPFQSYSNDDKTIAKIIYTKQNQPGGLSEKDILKILNMRNIEFPITGEYCSDGPFLPGIINVNGIFSPVIYMYYHNSLCSDWAEYSAKLAQCLAHEYFHHVHNVVSNGYSSGDSPEHLSVCESLADFFAELYLMQPYNNTNRPSKKDVIAKERYLWWQDYSGSSVPYANARWYYHVNKKWHDYTFDYNDYKINGQLDKFFSVFDASKSDMAKAYKILQQ